jgi:tetratricopeptide (TPR) repeat protein
VRTAVVLAAVTAAWGIARADGTGLTKEERAMLAHKHFQLGRDHYALGEYELAAREFEQGYANDPQPLFLYNVGQSARRAGQPDKAIAYYRRYLDAAPHAIERPEIEGYLRELERAPHAAASLPPPPRAAASRSRRLWIGLGVGSGAAAVLAIVLGVTLGVPRAPPASTLGTFHLVP